MFVADENFVRGHTKPGILSMANTAKDRNGSQFYIHMSDNRFFDGSSVVFGEVADGEGLEVLHRIEELGSAGGWPSVKEVKISRCGVV